MPSIAAVDLFCGAGGLSHGLLKADINVVAGYDVDEMCGFPYERNNERARFFHRDVTSVTADELAPLYPDESVKLLAGCAPCQPFSKYSQGRDVTSDKKWPLLYEFARLIKEVQPELVTMENVPEVVKHQVYHDFVADLENQGYFVWAESVYCPEYGVPQSRTRHVLLASKLGEVELIPVTRKKGRFKTVEETIGRGKLRPLKAGECDVIDPLHKASALSPLNLKRIKVSKPGGTWRDWPEDLRAECHRRESGRSYGGVYARMRWDEPSPTMTTQCYGYGNGRFGHPDQDRAISLREAAMLQTFPKAYQFVPKGAEVNFKSIGRMIGNAVPVRLGVIIGRSLAAHVNKL
ncbi:DNA cytosine methyltransferase [Microbulbifer sp. VTAC004]|uniref:DNA cytosine methyltransferase n=1 Tax=Microbulbifer sp. VTAC004 TaxID=3243386 RepID=UPI00403A1F47